MTEVYSSMAVVARFEVIGLSKRARLRARFRGGFISPEAYSGVIVSLWVQADSP